MGAYGAGTVPSAAEMTAQRFGGAGKAETWLAPIPRFAGTSPKRGRRGEEGRFLPPLGEVPPKAGMGAYVAGRFPSAAGMIAQRFGGAGKAETWWTPIPRFAGTTPKEGEEK